MKNKQTNVGSFATAKLQAKRRSLLAIIALVAEIGFSFAACSTVTSPTPALAPTPTSGGRDSRLVNAVNEAWVDNFPVGNRDGFVFKADGMCYIIDDYTDTTPGVFKIYGAAISWTTSGNNTLIISFGADSFTYSYTVTSNTLALTYNGEISTYTKTSVAISGI
jgi:hypothetical protein